MTHMAESVGSLRSVKGLSRFVSSMTISKGLLVCFAVGFVVRLVPELLALSSPIGFDTVYYASAIKNGVVWPNWSLFFTSTWLLYAVALPIHQVLTVDPFLLLKVLAPAFFGLNVAGIFWFAKKALRWDSRLSLLAGGFFALQLASLRISWDLLRNTLGMAILLFALPFFITLSSRREVMSFVLLSVLAVFAHEYAAVTLFAVVLGFVLWHFVKEKRVDIRRLTVALPALAIFLVGLGLRFFPLSYAVGGNVVSAGDVSHSSAGGLFFMVNYLSVRDSVQYYPAYWNLALNVVVLFSLLYLPYLFLVWKGYFDNIVLKSWTILLLIGSFSCLVVPFFAVDLWGRWMFMLVYPFSFFAANGISNLLKKSGNRVDLELGAGKVSRKVKGMLLLTVLLCGIYAASPLLMNTVNAGTFSVPNVSVYFSFSPTVPYRDVSDVVLTMNWLDDNMSNDSCVLLHNAFLSWGEFCFDKPHGIIYFVNSVDSAVGVAFAHGYSRVYFVWWAENIGWYGITVPDYFTQVQSFGRMAVFEYSVGSGN
jgi:hypothetical protein